MSMLPDWVTASLDTMATLFVVAIGLAVVAVVVLFVIDVTQSRDTVRRNYPVIGRFRYLFQELGEFFRQYFFAMDREELPFNRAQREWIDHASKGESDTVPFGSTKRLDAPGTPIFINAPFPPLEQGERVKRTIGAGCKTPFDPRSFFNISGMSYGAISKPAIKALSRGAAKAGCWLNTGEGGLTTYHLDSGADIVFQIGTAKYGVRDEEGNLSDDKLAEVAGHKNVRMFEVKLAQGAKPGKGGILPGGKVNAEVAQVRGIRQGEDSISPNRHTDIGSVVELLDFIARVRSVTGKPVGFKTVVADTAWLDDLADEIGRRGVDSAPDFITVDGGDGGTGAAPMPLIDSVGLPLGEALPLMVDTLARHGLQERVRVVASGKLVTPSAVAWAFCVGADYVQSARGFMFALGCIQALKCDQNTCPTGITTHKKTLQRGLDPKRKEVRVAHYVEEMVHGVETLALSCGMSDPRDLDRGHVRIVGDDGRSKKLNEVWPEVAA